MAGSSPALAAGQPPSLLDSFAIGTDGNALCRAQNRSNDPAISGAMFDRSWAVVCRDSAVPIGQVYALRTGAESIDAALARIAPHRREALQCSAAGGVMLGEAGAAIARNCTSASGIAYRVASLKRGRYTYIAEGFSSYSSAVDLALRTVVADRIIPGKVEVTTLGSQDATAFARLQARALDPEIVLAEGYRRNNSGNYAEAAEYFDSLTDRLAEEPDARKLSAAERANRAHEYAINRALQLSNLGEFDAAGRLFRIARTMNVADPVQRRLRRNFEAMNLLNQRDMAGALTLLDTPLMQDGLALEGEAGVEIDEIVAGEINATQPASKAVGVRQETRLTPQERAAIIDAQGQQLRGTALRLQGKPAEARAVLAKALADAVAIRDGRVVSITRLRAQLLGEMALTHEAQGQNGEAEGLLRQAVDLLAAQYPETVAMNGARARLAAFLARQGRKEDALALYRAVVASTTTNRNALTGLNNQLAPYFALLADEIPVRPELTADLFAASQALVRPGAADTMEVLSRELSAGNSEAARLFRQSVSLARDIERGRIELAQLVARQARDSSLAPQVASQQQLLDGLAAQQAATLTALAEFPQYRAVSKDVLAIADLQAALKPGEAYLKLARIGDALYGVWIDGAGATGYRVGLSADEMEKKVAALRETISTTVNGQQTTYPFDVAIARQLYTALLAPVEARLGNADHIVFEPDGAMLQLPLTLLVAKQEGVDAYLKRTENPNADAFDFRGIEWVGRSHAVSTALSARAFRDARRAPASAASRAYIGFGENAPVSLTRQAALTRSAGGEQALDCSWPSSEWSRPIPAKELRSAAGILGGNGTEIVTGSAFTDDALLSRGDLKDYRILHFATHGFVTAPRRECPARPALLTSFGQAGKSDGLLQFAEIFDMKLDADLVILSACDTAGKASREATRAAGLGTGGGTALDGLVRAFIGAGSRSVIASHWPAPEEFQATERLITGVFTGGPEMPVAQALREAQLRLMDESATSHPFYWAGFAIVGDGARPVLPRR